MKNAVILSLFVFSLILSACSPQSNPTSQVDYQATVTSYSVDIASLKWEKEKLAEENAELKAQIEQIEADNADIEGRIAELEAQSADSDESLALVSNTMMVMQDIFYGGESGEGLMILCPESDIYDFSYASIDMMVEELEQYIVGEYGIAEDQVTTEYEQIWGEYNDIIVKIRDGEYLRPFYVMFAVEGDENFNAVFDLTFQCYVDFPELEEKLLEVRGN